MSSSTRSHRRDYRDCSPSPERYGSRRTHDQRHDESNRGRSRRDRSYEERHEDNHRDRRREQRRDDSHRDRYRQDRGFSRDNYKRTSRSPHGYRGGERSSRYRSGSRQPTQPQSSDRRAGGYEQRDRRSRPDNDTNSQRSRGNCELRQPIWAPTPTNSEDEKDRLEEEKIIAKIQNRFHNNGSGSRSDSDSGSDTGDESSGSQRSDNGSRRRSTRKKHSSRSKRRSKSKASRTSKKPKSLRRKHRRRSESPSQSDASSHEDYPARSPVHSKPGETGDGRQSQDENSDSEIGPMPAQDYKPAILEHGLGNVQQSGDGLLSSGFMQSGDRIPRRGEIGMDLNKIEQWENAGYVMSGNRRSRVNDTHVQREGQVITADEKRQMLLQNQEERQKKEAQIISEFRDMLSKKRS